MDKSTLTLRARHLRKNSTEAERHLWFNLRAGRTGFKFKRQVPIGAYIVDFVCLEQRLIIELDGCQHMDNKAYDINRSAWLGEQGFSVLRFWNHEVFQQTSSVLEVIMAALNR
jgi:very-short-patch-repair endonuclease